MRDELNDVMCAMIYTMFKEGVSRNVYERICNLKQFCKNFDHYELYSELESMILDVRQSNGKYYIR